MDERETIIEEIRKLAGSGERFDKCVGILDTVYMSLEKGSADGVKNEIKRHLDGLTRDVEQAADDVQVRMRA